MTPKFGGPDLSPAPDVLPGRHREAAAYHTVLLQALDHPGWSARQRVRIRDLARKWLLRSEGRDPQFEKYGTFPRFEGTAPPTVTDWIIAKRRKRFPVSPDVRAARQLPQHKRLQQARRLRAQASTKALQRRRQRDGADDD